MRRLPFMLGCDSDLCEVTAVLMLPGEFTSCNRTHNLHGNLADLRALVAANQKGIHLVQELILSSATFDFEGTSPMAINKLNAPRAISKSAIIYSLRCMVGYDIPLNQGCLTPIPVHIHTIGSYSTPISRYAVVLKNFQLLPGTGRDGVLKKILFRNNLTLSVSFIKLCSNKCFDFLKLLNFFKTLRF
ncbi:5-oxoprolinase-like [Clavelina lepadiformis]|uniref:5-oxoprolinase-like n=1 Tax=Clavelina lepadiformis TaxID=159417 RepID=UPI0040417979